MAGPKCSLMQGAVMVGLGSWGWVKNQRCLHNEQVRGGEKLPLNVAKKMRGGETILLTGEF